MSQLATWTLQTLLIQQKSSCSGDLASAFASSFAIAPAAAEAVGLAVGSVGIVASVAATGVAVVASGALTALNKTL
jgi:hypothetical protein